LAKKRRIRQPNKRRSRARTGASVLNNEPAIYCNPQNPRTNHDDENTNKSIRNATWALVGTAIVGIIVAGLQWCTLQETNRLAAIEQRPYVSATDIRLTERQGILVLEVLVNNSGGTPTRDMRYLAVRDTLQPSDPADAFSKPPEPFQVHRGLVAPNATIPLGWGGYVRPLVEKMAVERDVIFLYGVIYYKGPSLDSSPNIASTYIP
jgi:hypothetical protein